MGRIDLDLAADRHTLWEAAAASLPHAEGEPGRHLVWEDFELELVATGRGGTVARLRHPGGLLAQLRWRIWLHGLARRRWAVSERLALIATVLMVAAVLSIRPAPAEVVVVAPEPAVVAGHVARGRHTTPDLVHFDDVRPYGAPLPQGFVRGGFGWTTGVPSQRDGRVFLFEVHGIRWIQLFTGLPGARDPRIGVVDGQLQVAFTVDGVLYVLDLTTLE